MLGVNVIMLQLIQRKNKSYNQFQKFGRIEQVKATLLRDFRLPFFHQPTSSRPNRQAQKKYQIILNVCEIIHFRK